MTSYPRRIESSETSLQKLQNSQCDSNLKTWIFSIDAVRASNLPIPIPNTWTVPYFRNIYYLKLILDNDLSCTLSMCYILIDQFDTIIMNYESNEAHLEFFMTSHVDIFYLETRNN